MCQTGAIGMAEAGLGYDRILRHYYRGASPRKVY
jgi:peptidoglycan hydrolase-like amidase